MWSMETPWFDVAVVLGIFAVGNILFGHFEAHRPKWWRLLSRWQVAIVLVAMLALSTTVGRRWAYGALLLPLLLGAVYVHLYWLPKHGINGWTGEPRERYLALVTKRRSK